MGSLGARNFSVLVHGVAVIVLKGDLANKFETMLHRVEAHDELRALLAYPFAKRHEETADVLAQVSAEIEFIVGGERWKASVEGRRRRGRLRRRRRRGRR